MRPRTFADWLFPKPRTIRRKNNTHQLGSALSRYLERLEDRLAPAVRVWTGLGANDLWSNAANWDVLPVDGDDVRIAATAESAEVLFEGPSLTIKSLTSDGTNPVGESFRLSSGTLTLTGSGPYAFTALDLSGTLNGTGNVTVGTALNWTAGSMNGSGMTTVASAATFTLSGTEAKELNGRTLVNDTTVTLSQGNLNLRDFALFDNNGIFNATDEADLVESNDGNSTFRNDGTFNKSGAGTLTNVFGLVFDNKGAVNVNSGTLRLERGGTSTASTWVVAGGGNLEFANSYTLDAASSLSGAGAGQFTGGTVTVNGSYALTGPTTISNTTNFNAATIISTLNLSGTLGGSGNVVIGSALNWSDGSMTGSGTTTVSSTATFNLSGTGAKELNGRTLVNNSTVTVSQGNLNLRDFALFDNNGIFNATDEADLVESNDGNSTFRNDGTFNKSGAGTTTRNANGLTFTNNGTVHVASGVFSIDGPFTNFAGGALTGGTYNIAGTLKFTGAAVTVNAANIVLDGAASQIVNQSNADALATFAGNAASGTFTIQNGRDFTPAVAFVSLGNVSIGPNSTFSVTNGGNSRGDWTIASTGNLRFVGGTYLLDDGTDITGAGFANIQGGTVDIGNAGSDVVNAERLKLTSGVLQGAGALAVSALTWTNGTMAGSGTTTILAGTTAAFAPGDKFLGRTLINQGTIDYSGAVIVFGTSAGSVGVIDNNGVFNFAGNGISNNVSFPSPSHAFNNAGTFNLLTNGLREFSGVQFNSTGSVNVNVTGGRLGLNGGGSSSGDFTLASGTFVDLKSTNYTLEAGASFLGAGSVRLGGVSGGGTTTIAGAVDAANARLFNAALDGPGNLTVSTTFDWPAGRMIGSGQTILAPTATMTIPGGGDKNLGRTLVNHGTINQSGTNFAFGFQGSVGVLNNNGVFNTTGVNSPIGAASSPSPDHAFNNTGTFNRSSAGETAIAGIQFNNSGTVNVLAGTLTLSGVFSNFSGTTLTGGAYNVAGTLKFTGANIVTNAATIVLDGAAAQIVNQSNVNALANFATNAGAGSFTIQNGRNFATVGAFSNAGLLAVAPASTFAVSGGQPYVQTGGTTTLNGALAATNANIQGGLLQGTGTVNGNVANAGQFGPGAATGILTINGNYTQTNAGSLDIEIGGLIAGSEFDQLVVSGLAALDGTVNVTRLGGFVPGGTDTFRIVSAGSRNGAFATVNGGLFPGGRLAPLYDATGAVLDANLVPIPDNDVDTTLEDTAVSTNVLGNDSDPDGDALSVVAVGTSAQGVTPINNGDGTISYAPPTNFFGTDSFTYTLKDSVGNEATATVTMTVTPVNDAPTLDPILDSTILEDGGPQTVNLTGITTGPNESQSLTVTAVSDNPGLIQNPTVNYTSPDSTGSLSFKPAANQSGIATIAVTVTDNGGKADGGVNTFSRAFTVTVTAVNDAPTLDPISDPPPVEGVSPRTVNFAGVTAGPNESQTLTVTAVSNNPGLIPDPAVTYSSPDATGSLVFTPVANQAGQAIITVTVSDNGGTANGGFNTFSRTFTVTAVNDAPTLDSITDPAPILEDADSQTINLAGITAGDGELQTLTVTAVSSNPSLIPNPTVTYTSPDATGLLSFKPIANQSGSAFITVTVKDNGGTALGGVDEITRTFTLNVSPVPDAPIVDTTPIQMLPAVPLKPAPTNPAGSAVADLLDGATEVDGEPLGIAITGIDNLKGKWQFSVNGGAAWEFVPTTVSATTALVLSDDATTRVRFLPNKGFQGFSNFSFKAWDQSDGGIEGTQVDSTLAPTAYSDKTERAWVAVGKTNPVVNADGATVLAAVKEDSKLSRTFTVKSLLGIAGLEKLPTTNLGIAITNRSTASGTWQFRLANSKLFVDVGVVNESSALLLRPIDTLRFIPNANADGQTDLTFKTWDQIGTAGNKVDTSATGFGVDLGFAVIDITAVNDAPVLDLSVPAVLDPVEPGQTTNEPTFASLMAATDVEGATIGVTIVATTGFGWEFKPVGGAFTPLGVVSSGKALLLNATDQIRFVAPPDAKPGTATLSFKAWDQFPGSGVVGTRVAIRGTAFSKQTEIVTVAIDNDAPVLNTIPGGVKLPDVISSSTKPIAGTLVKALLGTAVTDAAKSLKGIAIVFADNTNGKWQYSLGGNIFVDIGTVSGDSALLLADVNKLRFVPIGGFTGSATIQFKAWDRTTGQAGDRIDTDLPLNSFSLETETATVNVV